MISPLLTLLASGAPAVPPSDQPDWVSFYGDLRLRAESTLDQPGGDDRHRGRMRFRGGAMFQISDELKAEVRMSTYSGEDARNPHWDFGDDNGTDTLSGASVQLDRMNLSWSPDEAWTLVAGKMGAPFETNPVFGEWLWDGDIQPAGLAGIWSAGGDFDFDFRLAHFIVDEVDVDSTTDPAVTVLQVNVGDSIEDFDWDVHTALWDWNGGDFTDYSVWDTTVAVTVDELTASLEYFVNLEDDTGEDAGMALGLKYGSGGAPGKSQIFGSIYDFDGNASAFGVGQDDLPIAPNSNEGLSGFVVGWKYWWTDDVTFKVWALSADDETDDPVRLRFDVDVNLRR